jgi:hypothetical protein
MASIAGQSSAYAGANITLKAVHPNPFLEGAMRARIFIQQVDNKIVDVAGTSNRRKVRYAIFLLRGQAAEWAIIYTDGEEYTIFQRYEDFRKEFIERFIELNLTGTAIEKLLNLK